MNKNWRRSSAPLKKAAAAPWLVKGNDGDVPLVVSVGDDGAARYHRATEWEAHAGVFYKDEAEWRAARGEAKRHDCDASHKSGDRT